MGRMIYFTLTGLVMLLICVGLGLGLGYVFVQIVYLVGLDFILYLVITLVVLKVSYIVGETYSKSKEL